MPRSRPTARSHVSRRVVLAGASATPLIAGAAKADVVTAATSDPTITICQQWLAVEAELRKWLLHWGDVEGRLNQDHGWYGLSEAAQRTLPAAQELYGIGARLNDLAEDSERLLEAIPSEPATSLAATIARLTVAAKLLHLEDHPTAYGLVSRAVTDLAALAST